MSNSHETLFITSRLSWTHSTLHNCDPCVHLRKKVVTLSSKTRESTQRLRWPVATLTWYRDLSWPIVHTRLCRGPFRKSLPFLRPVSGGSGSTTTEGGVWRPEQGGQVTASVGTVDTKIPDHNWIKDVGDYSQTGRDRTVVFGLSQVDIYFSMLLLIRDPTIF